jgi:threonine/homoserine/homoserine lactone efflux protein
MISGATAGARRSVGALVAAVLGYVTSVSLLAAGVGPLVGAMPTLALMLKVLAALYLVGIAVALWKRGGHAAGQAKPVEFREVFIATLLNPKSLIFAFFVIPHLFDNRRIEALPYLLALAAIALAAGLTWILGGALIGISASALRTGGLAPRLGAVAQFSFATALLSSVFWG